MTKVRTGRDRGPAALEAVADLLRCPACDEDGLALSGGTLACSRGHRYDVARHGYVSLPHRGRPPHTGDTAAMVAARAAFLEGGHYGPIADAVEHAARASLGTGASTHDEAGGLRSARRTVLDLGAGTGHYLAALLNRDASARGIALDASRHALRRAVRAHPRLAGVACDVWRPLPVRDAAADLVLDVFAPRQGAEIARVLRRDGVLVVVTPTAQHLHQLVTATGMLAVGAAKRERLHADLAPRLRPATARTVEFDMALDRGDARALAVMGPSAHHLAAGELERRLAALPEPVTVTASVVVETFHRA